MLILRAVTALGCADLSASKICDKPELLALWSGNLLTPAAPSCVGSCSFLETEFAMSNGYVTF
jgi:hypothetical protein